MYLKDKERTLKARLTVEQDEYLRYLSAVYNVSRSEVLRIIIDSARFGGFKNG